ncbi:hypothetical protein RHGRI_004923 [Rhododendron griersonianum]|uniref:ATP-dependent DNA helicase n=1 Tax=Rhododendron griersonianum TaxID=479676 RepID=A0AAV6LAS0_9ERIC|nr:hypothetical protein RHGRI_004923 [Rhododendron griersonianum]
MARTMLTQFFWMNANHPKAKQQKLLYKNFPEEYVWDIQTRTWHERKQQEVIGRIVIANPKEGERYYLRLLLSHIPGPTSYTYLRTVQGITYNSDREAAVAYGLLQADDSNEKCMEEACVYRMPMSLKQLFCTILVYCALASPTELFLKFEDDMAEDYVSVQKLTKEIARQQLLQSLNSELQSMGKSLHDFQLSHLLTATIDHQPICKEVQDETNICISEEDLRSSALLNTEQTIAYNQILDAVFSNKSKSFFIDGPGGTGKTFLYRAILAAVRSQRKIALATASSDVAASILPNGQTAHLRFKIPINGEGKLYLQEIKVDGLTLRSIKYNFTPIADLGEVKDPDPNLDVLFAILEVDTRKPANDSYVTDIRFVDQSEYEAPAMASLPSTFPIANVEGIARVTDFNACHHPTIPNPTDMILLLSGRPFYILN